MRIAVIKAFAGSVVPFKTMAKDRIYIKELLKTLEITARIYAVQNGIRAAGTPERIAILSDLKIIDTRTHDAMLAAFDRLWDLRFRQQIISFSRLSKMDDTVPLSGLSAEDAKPVKQAVRLAKELSLRLECEFLGRVI